MPKDDARFVHDFMQHLQTVVVNFFLPIFFANTGLRTNLRSLSGSPLPCLAVLVLACLGKMLPPIVLGPCLGFSHRFSFQLAALMKGRGLIALVALDIAVQEEAFNEQMYGIFVVMALVTTALSGPLFYLSFDPAADPPLQDLCTLPSTGSSPSTQVYQPRAEVQMYDSEIELENGLSKGSSPTRTRGHGGVKHSYQGGLESEEADSELDQNPLTIPKTG